MFQKDEYSKIIAINISIISITIIFYLLYLWSSLILPFIIALLVSFWIISIANFFKNLWLNKFFSYLFSFISFFWFFFLIWWIINSNIQEMAKPKNIEFYQTRLETLVTPILDYLTKFNFDEISIKQKIIKNIDFSNLFGNITWAITSIISNAWLIIIYILFILLEYRFFKDKIELLTTNPIKKAKINSIINKIKNDVKAYFFIKTITSITTWFLSYITLSWARIDFALFWSFIIFILNFIPTIGSIIAVWIVSIFLIIKLWFSFIAILVISILIWIQILIWNLIEPKLMWNKLNLSPLVILLSLGLWGKLWWVIWMLLSVPIMVIINIILSKFESTKAISILLSEKWIIDSDEEITIEKTRDKLYKLLKNKIIKK